MIFITLGSQKFQFNRLLKAVDEQVAEGKITEQIFAQIGVSDFRPQHYEYKNFLNRDEFNDLMNKADIVITHGGTGAIISAIKNGKKVIAIPRLVKYGEHVDDHQLQLIEQFKELDLICECQDCNRIWIEIEQVKKNQYKTYHSNTSRIIESIEEFIERKTEENVMVLKRIQYLEYLRVISMFCVILIHSSITAVNDFSKYSFGTYWGVFFYAVRNICHFAVPIFFMISGALLLNPNKDLSIAKLLKKYISKYLILILIFGWGFAFAEEIFTHHSFAGIYLITSFKDMVEGNSWNHMWYLYELVGILLIIPILRILVNVLKENEEKYVRLILFLFLSLLPLVSKIMRIEIGIRFPFKSIYVLYMLLGYWVFKEKKTIKNSACILLIVAAVGGCIIDSYLYILKNINIGLASYSSPIIVLMAYAIFALAKNKISTKDNNWQNKIIPFFSNLSLSVYINHMLWINMIYKVFKVNPFAKPVPVLMMIEIWAIVTIFATATAWIMKKIPLIKKII